MKRKIAKGLLDIEAVFLSPQKPFTWASGIKSPIYCDNRLILTAPEIRNTVEQAIADTVKENYPEAGVTLDYNDLGKKWEAMDADEKGHQLSEAVKIKDRGYERLAEAFRENDREKFERVVSEVEAELEPKEP